MTGMKSFYIHGDMRTGYIHGDMSTGNAIRL